MSLWSRTRPVCGAVSLSSGSESGSSSHVDTSTCNLANEQSGSASALSCSEASYHCAAPSQIVRRNSAASLQVFGGGVTHNGVPVGFLHQRDLENSGGSTTRIFLRTQSSPEFTARKKESSEKPHVSSQRSNSPWRWVRQQRNNEMMRLLILGAPQVGKSSLVNSYRAAVTNNMKWPAAPVGICGFCGTTTVDPFPNHPTEPTWLCIDTPGRFYDVGDKPLLERLFSGVPWKTRLAGSGALRQEEIEKIPIVPENQAHQCIIVVPATDLVEDNGWMSLFRLKSRYAPAPDAQGVVMQLRGMVFLIRSFLNDASPFVVVTKMDMFGGAGNAAVQHLISSLLTQCIPVNRLYFCACPDDRSSYETRRISRVDRDTRENLLRLHEDLSLIFHWRLSVEQNTQLCFP